MGIDLTWLGHSTVVVDIDGVRLVTDPLVRRHNGILRRHGDQPAQESWRAADAVLLSHLHHDHAEVASLREFAGVPVLTAPENAVWVRRKGLDGRGLGEGEWFPLGAAGVEVRLVRAVHGARPMPHRPNAANGHLVRGPSGVVWLAGDTELHDEMGDLPRLAGRPVDVAVVPVGGWGPRLSPGHMGPEEAAVACRLTGARHAVPVHWNTLHLPGGDRVPAGWLHLAGPRFREAVAREAPRCDAVQLEPGATFHLPDAPGEAG
ncbi:MBL fold metallo-hydrolase [Nocardioides jishulii]|uniref:MBL fold metallo-hydrolase n=1 Tax=Nocardioides jishulii TaxID=2575440 RepID=A0A4U2YH19_9ACTN|nr:MBL fold metallo-hydrolase [Nocardioides jishulii]QCX26732.1 MBL fold metallo-hydrolase [Nocardioides jishulii]TKI60298.1 MBL fold metallo-hydrolase [Nocardioides jishulii]